MKRKVDHSFSTNVWKPKFCQAQFCCTSTIQQGKQTLSSRTSDSSDETMGTYFARRNRKETMVLHEHDIMRGRWVNSVEDVLKISGKPTSPHILNFFTMSSSWYPEFVMRTSWFLWWPSILTVLANRWSCRDVHTDRFINFWAHYLKPTK